MPFTPSKYQSAIFDFVATGTGSAVVDAKAGSGKTTTILEAMKLIPSNQKAIFLAFNTNIAKELKARVPPGASASTFHSAGFSSYRKKYPRVVVDNFKVANILADNLPEHEIFFYGGTVQKLVSFAKQRGLGVRGLEPNDDGAWSRIIEHHSVTLEKLPEGKTQEDGLSRAVEIAKSALRVSTEIKLTIDYDDMIFLPLVDELRTDTYDWVFVDEAQDTNPTRRKLAGRLLAPGGRLVAVGDPGQSIYGFTGADSDAMHLIQAEFSAKVLPLSISYRCSKAVVRVAQRYVPDIESAGTAPEGKVATLRTFADEPPETTSVILCRNTAPLVSLAFQFIAQGTGVRVRGRDIGQGLQKLIKQVGGKGLEELLERLHIYMTREVGKLLAKRKEMQAQAVEDKVQSLIILAENMPEGRRTITELDTFIVEMFQDDVSGLLTLSTVHKAKGLEWLKVYIYRPELMPSKWARQPWELQQEQNLQYVAATRARLELYYVPEQAAGRSLPQVVRSVIAGVRSLTTFPTTQVEAQGTTLEAVAQPLTSQSKAASLDAMEQQAPKLQEGKMTTETVEKVAEAEATESNRNQAVEVGGQPYASHFAAYKAHGGASLQIGGKPIHAFFRAKGLSVTCNVPAHAWAPKATKA